MARITKQLRRLAGLAVATLTLACSGHGECAALARAHCKEGVVDCDIARSTFQAGLSAEQCRDGLTSLAELERTVAEDRQAELRLMLLRDVMQQMLPAHFEQVDVMARNILASGGPPLLFAGLGDVPCTKAPRPEPPRPEPPR